MAYTFEKEASAKFKFNGENKLTLNGISGTQQSADTIVAGVQGLLYIGNLIDSYNPTDGIRTVNEDVNDDE